jgi:hypothetical protein
MSFLDLTILIDGQMIVSKQPNKKNIFISVPITDYRYFEDEKYVYLKFIDKLNCTQKDKVRAKIIFQRFGPYKKEYSIRVLAKKGAFNCRNEINHINFYLNISLLKMFLLSVQ